jgi:Putative DNA-binding domain
VPGLAETQAWMQAAILDDSAEGARALVRDGNRLTAEARIGLYATGYRLRLIECLRFEYPLLARLAGPTAFDLFAQGYVDARPSRSYTLYDFGARFADYLEESRPAGNGSPQAVEAVPAALARIERAKAEVLRARGVEQTGAPPARPALLEMVGLSACNYRRPDSVRLLALPFDFTATLSAGGSEGHPAWPRPEPSLLGVARLDYRVACHRLEGWQYDLLAALPEAGAPAPPPEESRDVQWLAEAARLGLAAAV